MARLMFIYKGTNADFEFFKIVTVVVQNSNEYGKKAFAKTY